MATRGKRGNAAVVDPEADRAAEMTTGRPAEGITLPKALAAAWKKADTLNAAAGERRLPDGTVWEYIPVASVNVDLSVLPRTEVDEDAVDRYAADWDSIPPIKVQKGTFTLVGGLNRLAAAAKAVTDHIKAVEVDIPDKALFRAAIEDNRTHGLTLNSAQRMEAAERLLKDNPKMSKGEAAKIVGMGRTSLWRWQGKAGENGQSPNGTTEAPAERQVRPRDWLRPLERATVGASIADLAADEVPDEEVRRRLTRVDGLVQWLSDYRDTLKARADALPPEEAPADQGAGSDGEPASAEAIEVASDVPEDEADDEPADAEPGFFPDDEAGDDDGEDEDEGDEPEA